MRDSHYESDIQTDRLRQINKERQIKKKETLNIAGIENYPVASLGLLLSPGGVITTSYHPQKMFPVISFEISCSYTFLVFFKHFSQLSQKSIGDLFWLVSEFFSNVCVFSLKKLHAYSNYLVPLVLPHKIVSPKCDPPLVLPHDVAGIINTAQLAIY